MSNQLSPEQMQQAQQSLMQAFFAAASSIRGPSNSSNNSNPLMTPGMPNFFANMDSIPANVTMPVSNSPSRAPTPPNAPLNPPPQQQQQQQQQMPIPNVHANNSHSSSESSVPIVPPSQPGTPNSQSNSSQHAGPALDPPAGPSFGSNASVPNFSYQQIMQNPFLMQMFLAFIRSSNPAAPAPVSAPAVTTMTSVPAQLPPSPPRLVAPVVSLAPLGIPMPVHSNAPHSVPPPLQVFQNPSQPFFPPPQLPFAAPYGMHPAPAPALTPSHSHRMPQPGPSSSHHVMSTPPPHPQFQYPNQSSYSNGPLITGPAPSLNPHPPPTYPPNYIQESRNRSKRENPYPPGDFRSVSPAPIHLPGPGNDPNLPMMSNPITASLTNSTICHICHKSFANSSNRNRHLRIHLGDTPYRCSYCPARFTHSSHRRRHEHEHLFSMPTVNGQPSNAVPMNGQPGTFPAPGQYTYPGGDMHPHSGFDDDEGSEENYPHDEAHIDADADDEEIEGVVSISRHGNRGEEKVHGIQRQERSITLNPLGVLAEHASNIRIPLLNLPDSA